MSWMAPKLNQRIQVCQGNLTANLSTSYSSVTFELIKEVWAELVPVSSYIQAIRTANTGKTDTHYFRIRKSAMDSIGAEFSKAFDSAFNSTTRSNPIKADYFIKLLRGTAYRLYRVTGTQADDQNKEFILIRTMEQEEDR